VATRLLPLPAGQKATQLRGLDVALTWNELGGHIGSDVLLMQTS
jgi:hypothetical protein